LRYFLILLALGGVLVSALAWHVHDSTGAEPCDINAHWDCGVVNHSRFAVFHGIPVAAIGLVGYALIGLLALLKKYQLTLIATLIGCSYALYLTSIEARVLQVWCLYCVISQALIACLLLLSVIPAIHQRPRKNRA
jgi:vitamin-K-epoxide reductase (warfarin-sensitive)